MEPHFDFVPATEWAAAFVALAEPYGWVVLVGMIVLPILVALYSGYFFSMAETLVLAVLVFFAAQQGEPVMAVALFGGAMLTAIWGFQRQREDRKYWQMRNELHDLSTRVEDFLDALDRRSRHLDLTFATSASLRNPVEDEPEPSAPVRLRNGAGVAEARSE